MTEATKATSRNLVAADVLKAECPLHDSFLKFVGNKQPTKRQGRRFLQRYPQYRQIQVTITEKGVLYT